MSLATLTQRLSIGPVPPVPSPILPEGTGNRAVNQRGSPGSLGSLEKAVRVEDSSDAPRSRWLMTTPAGEVFSLSRTPPATLAEIRADYPGAQVEPEAELPPGPALHPDDMALAFALLRHWGETDTAIGQEWIDGLAADPERRRQMYAEAVRLGIATFDPEPEAIATATVATPAAGAVCARCGHWAPSPINPTGGLGRCRANAPASRKAGACWPWPDADVRCREFDPVASEVRTADRTEQAYIRVASNPQRAADLEKPSIRAALELLTEDKSEETQSALDIETAKEREAREKAQAETREARHEAMSLQGELDREMRKSEGWREDAIAKAKALKEADQLAKTAQSEAATLRRTLAAEAEKLANAKINELRQQLDNLAIDKAELDAKLKKLRTEQAA